MSLRICIATHLRNKHQTGVALNLAASLALMEETTLFIGGSPTPACEPPPEAAGLVTGDPVPVGNASALRWSTQLDYLDLVFLPAPCREVVLQAVWEEVSGQDDRAVVMNLPGWHRPAGERMMAACSDVVIPLPVGSRDPEVLLPVLKRVRALKETKNADIRISGIVLTGCQHTGGNTCWVNRPDMKCVIGKIPAVAVPDGIKMRRAAEAGLPVALVDLKSPAAEAFLILAEILLSRSF